MRILLFVSTLLFAVAGAFGSGTSREIIQARFGVGKQNICALRDSYGFMWVGTRTGLSCYDGKGRSVSSLQSGILSGTSGQSISTLYEYGDNIWFGTPTGLKVFDRHANKVSGFPYRTKYRVNVSAPVQRILDSRGGRIWIITLGQGLFVFNTTDSTLVQNSRYSAFYSDLAMGDDGRMYTVTLDGRMQVFNQAGDFIEEHVIPGFEYDKTILRMTSAGRRIYISGNSELFTYSIDSHEFILPALKISPHVTVNSLIALEDEDILLATDDGLYQYSADTHTFTNLSPVYGDEDGYLPEERINSLTSDSDSDIIITTPDGGICYLASVRSGTRFIPLPEREGKSDRVNTLAVCGPDRMLAGTMDGLKVFDVAMGSFTDFGPSVAEGCDVSTICQTGDSLWVGTSHNGLFLYDLSTGALNHFTYNSDSPNTLISNSIDEVFHTSAGEIYVRTSWGFCRYVPEHNDFVTMAEFASHSQINAICEDHSHALWIASADNSLHRRKEGDRSFFAFQSQAIGRTPVTSLFCDSRGVVWAVTVDNHLFYLEEDAADFTRFNIELGQLNRILFHQEDLDGNIWIGTADGDLVKISPSHEVSYFYYPIQKLRIQPFESVAMMPDGQIYFGSDTGLKVFTPREMRTGMSAPKVFVQSLDFPYLDDSDEELRRLGLDAPLYTFREIQLPYSDNTFTLHLSSVHGAKMSNLRYDYILEGVDKTRMNGFGPSISYTNVAPGSYTFQVRSTFGNEAFEYSLPIVVLPPWYRTNTAYVAYCIAIIVLIAVAALVAKRQLNRYYRQRISDMRIQKERETFEEKTRFFINLVHEIRTPLTLINLPLEKMTETIEKGGSTSNAELRRNVASMHRNVNYLLGIINQLLDFRKADNGDEVKLVRSSYELTGLIGEIVRRFKEPLESVGKSLVLKLPDNPVYARIDLQKFDRVVMNLLGNAVKYSRKTIEVSLTVADGDNLIDLAISDDGPGVPVAEREKVFETYYQISGDYTASLGTGLGLAYAKLIAEAHGGSIRVEENPGGGAVFVLTLPVKAVKADAVVEVEKPAEAETAEPQRQEYTVLLVDDNKELLSQVSEALSEYYRVLTAADGQEAFDVLMQNDDVDLIISDYMMPKVDGGELARRVKSNVRFSHIPFIMLTAKTDGESKVEGLESGADIYIEKPFTIKQLRLQISNLRRIRKTMIEKLQASGISGPESEMEPLLNRVDAEFLQTLNDNIRVNVADEEFSIDVLAQQLNMSRSSFYRKLKAVTGLSPADYLKNFRLEYAAQLLRDGERVTEVALKTGFTSGSYFAKCFKAKYGCLPKDYTA
ncbi:MAG: response regulator [Muribaculaceae bacterium]|nr:response regulator [Muribaculaceae bacterium]